jgi:copper transport protein
MLSHPVFARHGRSSRRRIIGAIALLLMAGGPVLAHSFVRSTSPKEGSTVTEVPDRLVMRFNGAVEVSFGSIRVLDPHGDSVDEGDPQYVAGKRSVVQVPLADELPNGRYTVRWRVVAADGHLQRGRFAFRLNAPVVTEPSPEPSPTDEVLGQTTERPAPGETDADMGEEGPLAPRFLLGVTRWLAFSALLILSGAIVFAVMVWGRPKGLLRERPPTVEERFRARWRTFIRRAWIGAVTATVASIFIQGAVVAEVPLTEVSLGLGWDVLGTRFGQVALLRLAVLVVGAVVWRSGRVDALVTPRAARTQVTVPAGPAPGPGATAVSAGVPPRTAWAAGLWVVALLATVGLAGHAGTTPPVPLNLAADLLHVLGASAWAGGLVMLLGSAFPAVRGEDAGTRLAVMAPVISRFSDVAVVSIGAVVASGVFRAWLELDSLSALPGTSYGRALIVKLIVFLPVLVLGGINNRVTKPACEMALLTGADDRGALDRLRRLVALEVALAVVIIAVTAFLVNLPPPGAEPGQHL